MCALVCVLEVRYKDLELKQTCREQDSQPRKEREWLRNPTKISPGALRAPGSPENPVSEVTRILNKACNLNKEFLNKGCEPTFSGFLPPGFSSVVQLISVSGLYRIRIANNVFRNPQRTNDA